MLFVLNKKTYDITDERIVNAMTGVSPEGIGKYMFGVNEEFFPVKQVLHQITGLPKIEFTTADALRILRKFPNFTIRNQESISDKPKYEVIYSEESKRELREVLNMETLKDMSQFQMLDFREKRSIMAKLDNALQKLSSERIKKFEFAEKELNGDYNGYHRNIVGLVFIDTEGDFLIDKAIKTFSNCVANFY